MARKNLGKQWLAVGLGFAAISAGTLGARWALLDREASLADDSPWARLGELRPLRNSPSIEARHKASLDKLTNPKAPVLLRLAALRKLEQDPPIRPLWLRGLKETLKSDQDLLRLNAAAVLERMDDQGSENLLARASLPWTEDQRAWLRQQSRAPQGRVGPLTLELSAETPVLDSVLDLSFSVEGQPYTGLAYLKSSQNRSLAHDCFVRVEKGRILDEGLLRAENPGFQEIVAISETGAQACLRFEVLMPRRSITGRPLDHKSYLFMDPRPGLVTQSRTLEISGVAKTSAWLMLRLNGSKARGIKKVARLYSIKEKLPLISGLNSLELWYRSEDGRRSNVTHRKIHFGDCVLSGRVFLGDLLDASPAQNARVRIERQSGFLETSADANGFFSIPEATGTINVIVQDAERRRPEKRFHFTKPLKRSRRMAPFFLGHQAAESHKLDLTRNGRMRRDLLARDSLDAVSISIAKGTPIRTFEDAPLQVRRVHVSTLAVPPPPGADTRFVVQVSPSAKVGGRGATLTLPNIHNLPSGAPSIVYGYHAGNSQNEDHLGLWTAHKGFVSADGRQVIVPGIDAFSPFIPQGAGDPVSITLQGTVKLPQGIDGDVELLLHNGDRETLQQPTDGQQFSIQTTAYEHTEAQVFGYGMVNGFTVFSRSETAPVDSAVSGSLFVGEVPFSYAFENLTATSGHFFAAVEPTSTPKFQHVLTSTAESTAACVVTSSFGELSVGFIPTVFAPQAEASPVLYPLRNAKVSDVLVIRGVVADPSPTNSGTVTIVVDGEILADSAADETGFTYLPGVEAGTRVFTYTPPASAFLSGGILEEGWHSLFYVPEGRALSETRVFEVDLSPVIVVSSVNPAEGSTLGGPEITISGFGFLDHPQGTQIHFGVARVTSFTILNSTTIVAELPSHSSGEVDVSVSIFDQTSVLKDAFRYFVDDDNDGLEDSEEFGLGTDPNKTDTDGDGLSDGAEIAAGTNPLIADTDGDGVNDGDELAAQPPTDPLIGDTFAPGAILARSGFPPFVRTVPVLSETRGTLTVVNPQSTTATITTINIPQTLDFEAFELDNVPAMPVVLTQGQTLAIDITGRPGRVGIQEVEIVYTTSSGDHTEKVTLQATALPKPVIPETLTIATFPGQTEDEPLEIFNDVGALGNLILDEPQIDSPFSVLVGDFPLTVSPGTTQSLLVTLEAGDFGEFEKELSFLVNDNSNLLGTNWRRHEVTLKAVVQPGARLSAALAIALGSSEERSLIVEQPFVGASMRVKIEDPSIVKIQQGAAEVSEITGVSPGQQIVFLGKAVGGTEVSVLYDHDTNPGTPEILLAREPVGVALSERAIRILTPDRLDFIDLPSGSVVSSFTVTGDPLLRGSDPVIAEVGGTGYALFQRSSGKTTIYSIDAPTPAELVTIPTPAEALSLSQPDPGAAVPGVEAAITTMTIASQPETIGVSIDSLGRMVSYKIPGGQVLGSVDLKTATGASGNVEIEEDIDILIHGVDGTNRPPKVFVLASTGHAFVADLPNLTSPTILAQLPAGSRVAVDPVAMGPDRVVMQDDRGTNLVVLRSGSPETLSTYQRTAWVDDSSGQNVYYDSTYEEVDAVATEDGLYAVHQTAFGHAYLLEVLNPTTAPVFTHTVVYASPNDSHGTIGVDPVIAGYDPSETDLPTRLADARVVLAYNTGHVRVYAMDGSERWTFGGDTNINWVPNIDLLLTPDQRYLFAKDGQGTIRWIDLLGSFEVQLVKTIPDPASGVPLVGVDPVLTPDGKRLVDISANTANQTVKIFIHNVDPVFGLISDPIEVGGASTSAKGRFQFPAPDVDMVVNEQGTWVAYTDKSGTITIFDLEGTILVTIPGGGAGEEIKEGVDLVLRFGAANAPGDDEDWAFSNDPDKREPEELVDPPPFLDEPIPEFPPGDPEEPEDPQGNAPENDAPGSVLVKDPVCICVGNSYVFDALCDPSLLEYYTSHPECDINDLVYEWSVIGPNGPSVISFTPTPVVERIETGTGLLPGDVIVQVIIRCDVEGIVDRIVQFPITVIVPERLTADVTPIVSLTGISRSLNTSVTRLGGKADCLAVACGDEVYLEAESNPGKCVELLQLAGGSGTSTGDDCQPITVPLVPDFPNISSASWFAPLDCKVYKATLECVASVNKLEPIYVLVTKFEPSEEITGQTHVTVDETATFTANLCDPLGPKPKKGEELFGCRAEFKEKGLLAKAQAQLTLLENEIRWTVTDPSGNESEEFVGQSINVTPSEEGIYELKAFIGSCQSNSFFFEARERTRSEFTPSDEQIAANNPPKTGDPVATHSGEFIETKTDLAVPGRGLPFEWKRRYASRVAYRGPLGNNWDFTYNERLVYDEGTGDVTHIAMNFQTIYASTGTGALDYQTPDGHYKRLRRNDGDNTFSLRHIRGSIHTFLGPQDPQSASKPLEGVLLSITDRTGNNALTFEYDTDGRLQVIRDTYNRVYTLTWSGDLIVKLTDFGGREVVYDYYGSGENDGSEGDLKSARSPVISGMPNGNDFPNGRKTVYTYYTGAVEPEILHNIKTITRPNEVASNGPPYLQLIYGLEAGDPLSFDRVVTQVYGGTNASGIAAGGTFQFYFQDLNEGASPSDLTIVRRRTIEIDPAGNVKSYDFNVNHQQLEKRTYTGRVSPNSRPPYPIESRGAPVRSNLPSGIPADLASYATQLRYNKHGEITLKTFPQGNAIEYTYAFENDSNPFVRGNLTQVRWIADTIRATPGPGATTERAVTYSYEPWTNEVATTTNARGNDSGYDGIDDDSSPDGAAKHTTTTIFDYQERPFSAVQNDFLAWGITAPGGFAFGLGDVNGDGVSGASAYMHGLPIQSIQPTATVVTWNGSALDRSSSTSASKQLQYNQYGQVLRSIDEVGTVTDYDYHPATDPDGDGADLITGNDSSTGGYLASVSADTAGENRSSYQFLNPFGYPIKTVDNRGVVMRFIRNQQDQVVRSIVAESIDSSVAGPAQSAEGLVQGLGYVIDRFYDANGNVVRVEVENRDSGTDAQNPTFDEAYVYDILNKPVRFEKEINAFSIAGWDYRYDANQNKILTRKPAGNTEEQTFDERDLLYEFIDGSNNPSLAATTTYAYDPNGSLAFEIDAEDTDGDGANEYKAWERDGWDRVIESSDGIGQYVRTEYDVSDFVTKTEIFGTPGGATTPGRGSSFSLLSRQLCQHDERGWKVQVDEEIFPINGGYPSSLATVEGPVSPGDGYATSVFERDSLGRVVRTVDDRGNDAVIAYNGLSEVVSRQTAVVYGGRNEVSITYDRGGNPFKQVEVERLPGGGTTSFTTVTLFDALNRPVRSTDPIGQTTYAAYDSRGFVTVTSDAKSSSLISDPTGTTGLMINGTGNTRRMITDGLGRKVVAVSDLRPNGLGTGSPSFSSSINPAQVPSGLDTSNSANPDGMIREEWVYDGNSRLIASIDDRGAATRFTYDALDRRKTQLYADGSTWVFDYDRDSNYIRAQDPKGTVIESAFDGIDRATTITVSQFGAGVEGTGLQTFEYDGLTRVTRSLDNNESSTTSTMNANIVVRQYDSLGNVLKEDQSLPGSSVTVAYQNDSVGNRIKTVYPDSTRTITRSFDALNRPTQIDLDQNGTPITLASFDFAGPGSRVTACGLGNGLTTSWFYDSKRRLSALETRTGVGGLITGRGYSYDRNDQRVSERYIERPEGAGFKGRTLKMDSRNRLEAADTAVLAANESIISQGPANEGFRWKLDGVSNWVAYSPPNAAQQSRFFNLLNQNVEYGFDANGNRSSDGRYTYVRDAFDRLLAVKKLSGETVEAYSYDAENRRVAKVQDVGTQDERNTRFLYESGHAIEERVTETSQTNRTYYGLWADHLIAREDASGLYYFHSDAVNSPTAVTNTSGIVLERYEYTPFGEVTFLDAGFTPIEVGGEPITESSIGNPYLFTGRRLDSTGHYFFRARYYDPKEGRFLSRDGADDALNLGNLYTYVGNNPANYTDPWGLSSIPSMRGGMSFSWENGMKEGVPFLKGFIKGLAKGIYGATIGDAVEKTLLLLRFTYDPKGAAQEAKEMLLGSMHLLGALVTDPRGLFNYFDYEIKNASPEQAGEWLAEMFVYIAAAIMGGSKGAKRPGTGLNWGRKGGPRGGIDGPGSGGNTRGRPNKPGSGSRCFLAGTMVVMADGSYKPIEEVKVGDEVLSRDEKTGEMGGKKVTKLLRGRAVNVCRVTIARVKRGRNEPHRVGEKSKGKNSEESDPDLQEIHCTRDHPFYSESRKDWIDADCLRKGELLQASDGGLLRVVGVGYWVQEAPTYNLEIEGWHTYFVSKNAGISGIMVHNGPDNIELIDSKLPEQSNDFSDMAGVFDPKTGKITTYNGSRTYTPRGRFIFATMPDGSIHMERFQNAERNEVGHSSFNQNRGLRFAGEIRFDNGRIQWWDNGSGHYEPPPRLARQAGLPMDKFRTWEETKFRRVPRRGPNARFRGCN